MLKYEEALAEQHQAKAVLIAIRGGGAGLISELLLSKLACRFRVNTALAKIDDGIGVQRRSAGHIKSFDVILIDTMLAQANNIIDRVLSVQFFNLSNEIHCDPMLTHPNNIVG